MSAVSLVRLLYFNQTCSKLLFFATKYYRLNRGKEKQKGKKKKRQKERIDLFGLKVFLHPRAIKEWVQSMCVCLRLYVFYVDDAHGYYDEHSWNL